MSILGRVLFYLVGMAVFVGIFFYLYNKDIHSVKYPNISVEQFKSIKVGMTTDEVTSILGKGKAGSENVTDTYVNIQYYYVIGSKPMSPHKRKVNIVTLRFGNNTLTEISSKYFIE
jgi:outer membrane protein assembly factor BamE (lipoprotein component of BamABCDE complex)